MSRAFLAAPNGNSVGLREKCPAQRKEIQTRSTLTIWAWISRPVGAS